MAWNTITDRLNPKHGELVALSFAQTSSPDYQFYTLTTEAKKYYALGWQTVVASRLKIGLADAFGPITRLPISERLYAGGEKSVRGYGRRRLGPLSRSDDPLGGLSLIEGSVELRRPVWKAVSGAVFVDFGQLETRLTIFRLMTSSLPQVLASATPRPSARSSCTWASPSIPCR